MLFCRKRFNVLQKISRSKNDFQNLRQIFFQVAAEVAAPLSQAKKITMVSDGTGEIGASRVTGEVG
jgi:hypothetical protein